MTKDEKQRGYRGESNSRVSRRIPGAQKHPDPAEENQSSAPQGESNPNETPPVQTKTPPWEAELDTYPLRQPSEDPRWAVRTVGCWVVFALASLAFILALLVLGAIYD